jgi:chitinase
MKNKKRISKSLIAISSLLVMVLLLTCFLNIVNMANVVKTANTNSLPEFNKSENLQLNQNTPQTRVVTSSSFDDKNNVIKGLDGTYMWETSLNAGSWEIAKTSDTFKGDQTVKVAKLNEWGGVKPFIPAPDGSGPNLEPNSKWAYKDKLWEAVRQYPEALPSDAAGSGWKLLSDTPPVAEFTFNFTMNPKSEIEAYLKEERERRMSKRKVFAYMPSWGVYGGHEMFDVTKMNYDNFSHITYSFLKPVDVDSASPTIVWDDEYAAIGNGEGQNSGNLVGLVEKMREGVKAHEGKYFVFSVGGWTYSEQREFERACSTPAKISAFAQNMVDFMHKWGFDGIDIDWEFPEDAAAAQQFLDLHRVIREKLTELSYETEKYYGCK